MEHCVQLAPRYVFAKVWDYHQPDFISLLILVLLGVLLSTFEDLNTLLPSVDLGLDGELGPDGAVLCLSLATLQDSLGDCGELGVRHSSEIIYQRLIVINT